ncbi:MAG TPA: MFS transporter [Dehalococcoidia bacterium]|nr:MFS transporter [Dehalococcoidia bacterium]
MILPKIFYGYWLLLACFILNVISAGCGPISFSFFVTSLEEVHQWSRTEIMTGFSLFFIFAALSGPFAGRMVHRFGARGVVSLGGLSSCIGYLLLSQMSGLWQYYIGYALIGTGVAASGPVITTLVISNWFIRRRGMAIGAMSMGAGTAGMIFTPLVLVYLLPNLGWDKTYLTYAGITAVLAIPLAILVIRTHPVDKGLLPDGRDTSEIEGIAEDRALSNQGLPFRNAVTSQAFWLLAVAIFIVSSHMGIMQNQIPHMEDLGFSAGIIASAMSVLAVMSTISTLVFGWLSDKIRVKFTAIIAVSIITIAIVLLININSNSPDWLLVLYTILMGLGIGGWMPTMSLLTSVNFGLLAYGTIYGSLNAFQSISAGTSPILSGYLFDLTKTYEWAFIITAIAVALGIPTILAIRRPKGYITR